jgi:hypothetical protein
VQAILARGVGHTVPEHGVGALQLPSCTAR